MTKGEIAKNIFEQGVNCAQAVALAFKDEMGLTEDQIKKLIIGFGGGFGRQRLVCGAVSGMTMVLSYLKSDGEDKLAIYKIIQAHHSGTWDRPVGKPRGKSSLENLAGKPQIS